MAPQSDRFGALVIAAMFVVGERLGGRAPWMGDSVGTMVMLFATGSTGVDRADQALAQRG